MTFIQENLVWILIIAFCLLWLVNWVRDGYQAWKFPQILKRRRLSSAEKWPKWHPFGEFYLEFYNSDNFVGLMRLGTVILPIGIAVFLYMLAKAF
jgi:hypothetical protein